MYVPSHFAHDGRASLHDVIEQHAFAIIVATQGQCPEAVHVPTTFEREGGRDGTLSFHLARANPLCEVFDGGREALAIFSGPHAYVSPHWYESNDLVPTWNYVAVHAYGCPAPIDDAALCRQLERLASVNETVLAKPPWRTDELDPAHFARMRRGVRGFAMPVARLEGKWKLNQNRSAADRAGVARALASTGGEDATAIAGLINAALQNHV